MVTYEKPVEEVLPFGSFAYLSNWALTPSDGLILTILFGLPFYLILACLDGVLQVLYTI